MTAPAPFDPVNDVSPRRIAADIKVAKYATEGGHWYTPAGELIEWIAKAKGDGYRPTTLRDARKMQLAPGVTTIIRCAAAPQLVHWQIDQAIMAALTLPRDPHETEAEWLARVKIDMREQATKAAEEGTRIHAAIERSFYDQPIDAQYRPHVDGVCDLLQHTLGKQHWLPEHAAVHPLGYATKADLHSHEWLIDFKGKDGDQATLDALRTYDQHHMQLAATRAALQQKGEGYDAQRAAIVFVSRTHPGACSIVEITEPQLERGWAMFCDLLSYWQHDNGYRPDWRD